MFPSILARLGTRLRAIIAQEGKVAVVVPTAISRRWRSRRSPLPWLAVFAVALIAQAQAAGSAVQKKLVMLIAESEYHTAETLPAFAARYLQKDFRVVVVSGSMAPGAVAFSNLDELADADVLLVSVRRRTPPQEQMAAIRRYVQAGRPVVGIRTACHAFKLMRGTPPAGDEEWPEWDAQVIGGNYHNHYRIGAVSTVTAIEPDSPLLDGVGLPFETSSTLYKVSPLRPGAKAVMQAAIAGEPAEPAAWTFTRADGGRTFYTSLGSPEDFRNPSFTRLLKNGIFWAAGLDPKEAAR